MIYLTFLKFFVFLSILCVPNCLKCNNLTQRSILRGNYQNVLKLQQGPLIISKKTNGFPGGFDNSVMFRDSIYYVTGYIGFTYCDLLQSITIELKQTYELNTLVFWLWDYTVRTYNIVVYAYYEGKETKILDTLAIIGVVRVKFNDQLVKQFRLYNRNGNTENPTLFIIKAEAFYEL